MSDKFKNVPVDEDTAILHRAEGNLGEYHVLYEKWSWEGVTADCFIFANEDIQGLTDQQIIEEVKTSPMVKGSSKIDIKRSDSGFTFVSFNFEAD